MQCNIPICKEVTLHVLILCYNLYSQNQCKYFQKTCHPLCDNNLNTFLISIKPVFFTLFDSTNT